jgi:hypothetical protein
MINKDLILQWITMDLILNCLSMAYVWDFCLQVKAWMADKEAEALRNQQELVKEEEAAQMKWVLVSKTHLT